MTPTIDNLNLLISSKVNLIDNILLEDNYNESIYSGLSLIERNHFDFGLLDFLLLRIRADLII